MQSIHGFHAPQPIRFGHLRPARQTPEEASAFDLRAQVQFRINDMTGHRGYDLTMRMLHQGLSPDEQALLKALTALRDSIVADADLSTRFLAGAADEEIAALLEKKMLTEGLLLKPEA